MRIGRNFAEQEPCEKPRLDLDQAAHRDLIAEERMRRLLIEPPFVSGDQASPRLGPQIAAAGGKDEILGSELAIIERHENGGIGKNGPERLDEIERQGGPPRPLDMVEPLPGIEPGNGNCRREGAGQKGVAEREASIDGIGGRAPVAVFKRKGWQSGNFVGEKMRKGAEISAAASPSRPRSAPEFSARAVRSTRRLRRSSKGPRAPSGPRQLRRRIVRWFLILAPTRSRAKESARVLSCAAAYCAVRIIALLGPCPPVEPKNQKPEDIQATGISRRKSSCTAGVVRDTGPASTSSEISLRAIA